MVYNSDTLIPCHKLSERGIQSYQDMLEREGTRILERHFHPIRYFINAFKEIVKGLFR